jgi:hypothetical protein
MQNMGFTESSRLADMQEMVQPFRTLAASFEVDRRLDDIQTTLLLADRTLQTSNDRLQYTSAYLTLARQQYVMTEALLESISKTDGSDTKGPQFSYKALGGSLISGYQAVQTHLEAADRVSANLDFVADGDWAQHLQASAAWQSWLPGTHISGRYVRGAVQGLSGLHTHNALAVQQLMKNKDVSNMFKKKTEAGIQPHTVTVETVRRGLDRQLVGGSFNPDQPLVVAEQVLAQVNTAVLAMNGITLWISVPKLFDTSLAPAEPLDETGRGKRSFNPKKAGIQTGTPATGRPQPTGPAAPKTSAKPFDPTALSRPAPVVAPKPAARPSARPFDPNVSHPKETATPKASDKPFDPTALSRPAPVADKPFDPTALAQASPIVGPPSRELRAFDPSHIAPDALDD